VGVGNTERFALFARPGEVEIVTGPRIGLTKAVELPWRYGLAGSPFLSKPFKKSSSS
jgi:DNA-3-methyladenine glycosylase